MEIPRDEAAQFEPAASDVVFLSVWLAILLGFFEVGSLLAIRRLTGTVTYETLRTNWHYGWMIPVSYVLLFSTVGLGLGLLRWAWPAGRGFRVVATVLAFLTLLAVAMAIPRLHGNARLILALGAALQAGRWMNTQRLPLCRLARRTLPALGVGFLVVVGWQWTVVSGTETRALAALPRSRPGATNLLLIVLDTARFDGIFPTPPRRDPTPFLTRLATRGIRFDEARSTAPWTLPSHASMFTGRWPHELSTAVGKPLDDTFPTLAEHLSRNGYATAAFMGNTHNGNAWYGLDRGFAHYEDHYENNTVSGLELLRSSRLGSAFLFSKFGQKVVKTITTTPSYTYRKSAEMINRDTLGWIDRQTSRPFFAVLNYYDAHDPYVPPPGAPRPFSSPCPPGDERPILEQARDDYDDCLAYLDSQLERFFAALETRGLLDRTDVIITADHGEGFGEHALQGHGVSLYRPELHVPLLFLTHKGHARNVRIQEPVSLRDLAASIVELTGTAENAPFPGASLCRFWNGAGDAARPPAPILAEVEAAKKLDPRLAHAPTGRGTVRAVLTDGHVFIRSSDGHEELYDLNDVRETRNKVHEPNHDPPIDYFRARLEALFDNSETDSSSR